MILYDSTGLHELKGASYSPLAVSNQELLVLSDLESGRGQKENAVVGGSKDDK
ncbi:MAG: hypothetical protein PWP23_2261 [Candidatus Sumerlaeota bacterium]|nr:hypothetical protein [Candidatus Sumerlaeota bacterium]